MEKKKQKLQRGLEYDTQETYVLRIKHRSNQTNLNVHKKEEKKRS